MRMLLRLKPLPRLMAMADASALAGKIDEARSDEPLWAGGKALLASLVAAQAVPEPSTSTAAKSQDVSFISGLQICQVHGVNPA